MLKNYVISVVSSSERREHICEAFAKEKITFEFFNAITPDLIEEVASRFNINLAQADLTNGEKACFLSHISLWQKAIDDNLEYIAIFEDDIFLGEDIADYFADTNWIPEACDIIKLEY